MLGIHDNPPPGVSPGDNETGWRMALDNLAALVEADPSNREQLNNGFRRITAAIERTVTGKAATAAHVEH